MGHVTVVIVNWRLKEATLRCLRSLEQLEASCHIVVVDNGSGDGSAEYLASQGSNLTLLALPTNVGFAAACNQGIASALCDPACDFVFLLNNDALIQPGALAALTTTARCCSNAGILGPKVHCWDEPARLWYAAAERPGLLKWLPNVYIGHIDRGQFDAPCQTTFVFGAAMLIRRSVFERIGLFDQQFFLYMEDIDFCLRARSAGFVALFVPHAHVWHVGGASTRHNRAIRHYHLARSFAHFLQKNAASRVSLPILMFWIMIALRKLARDLADGDMGVLRAYYRGLLDSIWDLRCRHKVT
jgi:GT2 family glycosyltransferase